MAYGTLCAYDMCSAEYLFDISLICRSEIGEGEGPRRHRIAMMPMHHFGVNSSHATESTEILEMSSNIAVYSIS